MAERDEALFAIVLAVVFALEDRVVEHARSTHEIDAVFGEILAAELVVPLEHKGPLQPPIPEAGLIEAEGDLASVISCGKAYISLTFWHLAYM
jgi:hypothetical protein